MPDAKDVNPQKWRDIIVLYDNEGYSACWGVYGDEKSHRVLGVRWNNSYPSQGGKPLWYVEPEFTTLGVLQALLTKLLATGHAINSEYVINTMTALSEFNGSGHD